MYKFIIFLLLVFPTILFAQDFPAQWEEFKKANYDTEKKNKILDEILSKAKPENNPSDWLEASKEKLILQLRYKEVDVDSIFQSWEKLAIQYKSPLKNVIQATLAEMYFHHFRYRTPRIISATDSLPDKMSEWSREQMERRIIQLSRQSIENIELLATLPSQKFAFRSFYMNDFTKKICPNVADLLIHKHIETLILLTNRYGDDQTGSAKENKTADFNFLLGKEFANVLLPDSCSEIVKCYQKLVKIHSNDPYIISFLDLKRFKILKIRQFQVEKLKIYQENYLKLYSLQPFSAEMTYWYANEYLKKLETLKLCKAKVAQFPEEYTSECKKLIEEIEDKNFSINLLPNQLIDKDHPITFSIKNVKQIFYRIYVYEENVNIDDYVNRLAVKNGNFVFPDYNDYENHTISSLLPNIGKGSWVILFSYNQNFNKNDNQIVGKEVFVYPYSLVTKHNHSESKIDKLSVLSRNGKPVVNEEVEIDINHKKSIKKSDENGEFDISDQKIVDNQNNRFKIVSKTNSFASHDLSFYKWDSGKDSEESAHILTDRAIYRPGQKIYFKVILRNNIAYNTFQTLNNESVALYFSSQNGEVANMILKTNDFGSIDSFFVAPEGITGHYYITANIKGSVAGQVYFRIEEYKRPQFKAEIESPKVAIKLGDKIEAKGKAMFYTGVPVQQAKVKLTVRRNISSWYYYFSNSKTILDTVLTTNEKGEFPIQFIAETIENNNKKGLYYHYLTTAEITDMSGETHATQYHLYLSDIRYKISGTTKPQWINSEDFKLNISATTTAGIKVPAKVIVKAYQLQKKSFGLEPFSEFKRAEKFIGDSQKFSKQYPYYSLSFNKSELYDTIWTNINKEIQLEDGDSSIVFSVNDFPQSGSYGFSIFDPEHNVYLQVPFEVYSKNNSSPVKFTILQGIKEEKSYKVGDDATWAVSSDTSLYVHMEMIFKDSVVKSEWIALNKEMRWSSFKISPEMEGDFDIHVSTLFENHWFSQTLHFIVPVQKSLDLEWITWRDKTEPGSKEKWRLKVSHHKKPVQAEVLSVMYDKSLDAIYPHYLSVWPYSTRYSNAFWKSLLSNYSYFYNLSNFKRKNFVKSYSFRSAKFFNQNFWEEYYYQFDESEEEFEGESDDSGGEAEFAEAAPDDNSPKEAPIAIRGSRSGDKVAEEKNMESTTLSTKDSRDGKLREEKEKEEENPIALRKNLSELAYFAPDLRTDAQGEVWLEFTMPEALTEWKMMNLAHTKDFKVGQNQAITVTSKDLMVLPFTPRFFRMNDTVYFSANVFNKTKNETKVEAFLQFYNPLNDKLVELNTPAKSLTMKAEGQEAIAWKIVIPNEYSTLAYKIWVKSGKFTDGQEAIIPVLSNQVLVSESQPITVNPSKKVTVEIENVYKSDSKTLRPHVASLEITPNPAWFAVMALPYLVEFPHECSEQMFARLYANSLALNVIEKNPEIESVFQSWRNDSIESRLMRNEELKSLLKNETPWVLELDGEQARKKQMAFIFEKSKLQTELTNTRKILMDRQMSNGSWPWFPGGQGSFYITQHILTGFGKLQKMGVNISDVEYSLKKGQKYLIESIDEWIKKYPTDWYSEYYSLNTLYCLSLYPNFDRKWKTEMLEKLALANPEELGLWRTATTTIILKRYGKEKEAEKFIKYLIMSSIQDELKGMYYKSNVYGYSWWQDPIETQVRVIEAMEEMGEKEYAKKLRIWLLGQKRKSDWGTTKNTTEAISVLLNDEKLLSHNEIPAITWGGKKVDTANFPELNQEVGTGQFVIHQKSEAATKEFAKVEIKNNGKTQMWGGLHFKYFEDMDKVKSSGSSAIKIRKEMYVKSGKDWILIKPNMQLAKGDEVTVRLIIESDQVMEYIHISDYRASAFEPTSQLSGYQWKNHLGFYQAPKDVATHFFIDYLPAGKNILEYTLNTVHSGQFSNGNVLIESMYAPEFKAQSSGGRIFVK